MVVLPSFSPGPTLPPSSFPSPSPSPLKGGVLLRYYLTLAYQVSLGLSRSSSSLGWLGCPTRVKWSKSRQLSSCQIQPLLLLLGPTWSYIWAGDLRPFHAWSLIDELVSAGPPGPRIFAFVGQLVEFLSCPSIPTPFFHKIPSVWPKFRCGSLHLLQSPAERSLSEDIYGRILSYILSSATSGVYPVCLLNDS